MNTYKILLLGDSGVGKTSILRQFVEQRFESSHLTTIGIDHEVKVLKIGTNLVKLSIWDTAGQERFRSITKSYIRGIDCIILVYDVTNKISYDHINEWLSLVEGTAVPVMFYLVGNKCDLTDRQITKQEGDLLADTQHLPFCELSARSTEDVRELFVRIAINLLDKKPVVPVLRIEPEIKKNSRCC